MTDQPETWGEPLNCPHCGADLRDHRVGAPYKRELAIVENDYVSYFLCPDCPGRWERDSHPLRCRGAEGTEVRR